MKVSMRGSSGRRAGVIATLLAAIALNPLLCRGDDAPTSNGAPPAVKKKAEPKGRLPAYFSEVVSGEQRTSIYDIQAKYSAEIKKIQEQLDALVSKRDAEIEAVLSPEQKEKIAKMKADAKAKKVETAKKKAGTNVATQDAAPEGTAK